jgi:hypothetical protein
VPNEDRRRNVELLAKYVVPELRAHAQELGLNDPFDKRPGESKLRTGESRTGVVDREPLSRLNLR